MPLPAPAAKLMSELFGSDYQPRGNGVDVDSIASPLIPEHSSPKAGDRDPPGARILWDIAAEASSRPATQSRSPSPRAELRSSAR